MALKIDYPKGATPLDPDESEGLLPSGISTRSQLDELEAANILTAVEWSSNGKHDALSAEFAWELHRRMFRNVWRWAGVYRTSGKNIGIPAHDVPMAMQDLMDDTRAQIGAGELTRREIAIRFHHRLTKIHAFANGNGRHARLLTDLLMEQIGEEPFDWGAEGLAHDGAPRERYINALHCADEKNYAPLREFLKVDALAAGGKEGRGKK